MKKLLLPNGVIFCLMAVNGQAQESLAGLEKEISEIKSQMSTNTRKLDQQLIHIKKQDEKIASYERALKLLETKHEAQFNDVVLNIKDVIGNSKEGTLTFSGILVNEGNETIRMSSVKSEYFDNEGHQVIGNTNIKFGETYRIEAISGVPVKFEVVFKDLPSEKAAKVTALNLKVMDRYSKFTNVIFKNMDITWED